MIEQKVPLVCFKAGSEDIVGVSMLFVETKSDRYFERCYKQVKIFDFHFSFVFFCVVNLSLFFRQKQFQSPITKEVFDIGLLLYTNFEPFEHYGVDTFLTSFGLSVSREYRGRRIGDQFLETRKLLCKAYGLKFTQTVFSSDFSNRNADRAGFVTNATLTYELAFTFIHFLIKNPEKKILKLINVLYFQIR